MHVVVGVHHVHLRQPPRPRRRHPAGDGRRLQHGQGRRRLHLAEQLGAFTACIVVEKKKTLSADNEEEQTEDRNRTVQE